ncbi:hypothetical protein NBRC10512v2_001368 [Rhodotorula toruloides]|uniref:Zinc finger, MYND-type protein n=1 Tax=Rhodotorula toruloides (strain NP11) TaxID=1130832 RepID=M7XMD5_RHOT1|nr:zinc finger, MYND-type protein [Rhodotorula toruloides NP11]EMS25074.1 zinc finger, MYND-type protein [Rhodotorula toruloides NP11]
MSSDSTGKCLVCGTATKSRCSACVRAGIHLFFCSPEHQKFVWPVHRYFCGPGKANPWTWPALTPDEAREALEKLDVDPGPSFARPPVANPEIVLQRYLLPISKPTPLDSALSCIVRWFLCSLRFPPPNLPQPQLKEIPVLFLMAVDAISFKVGIKTEDWRTPLLHRLSVFASWNRSPDRAYEDAIAEHVHPDILKYLEEVVSPADPQAAREIRHAFLSLTAPDLLDT